MRWDYGGNNDKYRVSPGARFASMDGSVTLLCGDVDNMDCLRLFRRSGVPDIAYVDPPWNEGNLRAFHTKAGINKQGLSYGVFISRLLETVKACRLAFIEASAHERFSAGLRMALAESGASVVGEWPIKYYRKNPCRLLCCTWSNASLPAGFDPSGMDDEDTPAYAVLKCTAEGELVCDPCFGRGLTPVACVSLGRRFVGTELNPARMADALAKIEGMGVKMRRVEG